MATVCGNLNSADSIKLLRTPATGSPKTGWILLWSPWHLLPSLAWDSMHFFLLPVYKLETGPDVTQFINLLTYDFSLGGSALGKTAPWHKYPIKHQVKPWYLCIYVKLTKSCKHHFHNHDFPLNPSQEAWGAKKDVVMPFRRTYMYMSH